MARFILMMQLNIMYCILGYGDMSVAKDLHFVETKGDIIENLEAIEINLVQCSDEKMFDFQHIYYNQILDLIENTQNATTWAELIEMH